MTKGYYSLIQYCPDPSRAEAVNVGVVLFRPEPRFCGARIAVDPNRVRFLARVAGTSAGAVKRAAMEVAYRVEHAGFSSVEDFERFARSRGNAIVVTAPRPLRIEEPSALLETLCSDLVTPPSVAVVAAPRELPELHKTFTALHERAPDRAWVDLDFRVRDLELNVHADYAYRNGRLNLVQAVRVRPQKIEKLAFELNTIGELVESRLDAPDAENARLIVVTFHDDTRGDAERRLGAILTSLRHVDFVASDAVEAFARRVEREVAAHGR